MPRLTRDESRAQTRRKLLAAARQLVARDGFNGCSVDDIAETAGFSKGAFYSNFASKEEIFLELLDSHTAQQIPEVLAQLDGVESASKVVEILSAWADEVSRDQSWSLMILELIRHARTNQTFSQRHQELFRNHWRAMGQRLLALFPDQHAPSDAESLGALVCELAYAPAMTFSNGPSAGVLVALALNGLFAQAQFARTR